MPLYFSLLLDRGSKYYGRDVMKPLLLSISFVEGVQSILATIFWTYLYFSVPLERRFKIIWPWYFEPPTHFNACWKGVSKYSSIAIKIRGGSKYRSKTILNFLSNCNENQSRVHNIVAISYWTRGSISYGGGVNILI